MRFEGPLNIDLNEITSTLVPFPNLKVLQGSISPLFVPPEAATTSAARQVDVMFQDAFVRGRQLIRGDPRHAVHLACGLMSRGDIALSDAQRNVDRLKRELTMVHWNPDGAWGGTLCGRRAILQAYRSCL